MTTTPFYKSRTFWINATALAALIFPDVTEWLKDNPIEFTSALAAVNVLLRFITAGKHNINNDDPTATAPVTDASTTASRAEGEGNYKLSGTATDNRGDKISLALFGGAVVCSLIAGALALSSCGHTVTYTDDGRLVIRKDGVTVTIDRVQDAPQKPVVILPNKK